MGGRGGSVGGSQGTARVTRPASPAAQATPTPRANSAYDVSTMARMSDTQLTQTLNDIFTNTPVDSNQQNTDTQRFFNAIGWTARKPKVLDEQAYETARRQARAKSWYHTDDTTAGVTDAAKYSKQYLGGGRQFLSGGVYGDGTYWADSSRSSWRYGGANRAAQIKGFYNQTAKTVTITQLRSQLTQWQRSHPNAYQKIATCKGGYGNRISSTMSIFAAIKGYNVVTIPDVGYRTVLDRSATTVSSTIKHRKGSNTALDW